MTQVWRFPKVRQRAVELRFAEKTRGSLKTESSSVNAPIEANSANP